jgi:integrase
MLIQETFPIDAGQGGVVVKIYHTPTGKGYDAFTVVYYLEGKRHREQFGDIADARKRAGEVTTSLIKGEVGSASMTTQDRASYVRACETLKPTGIGLESACKEFAAACKLLSGVSVLAAAKYYVQRHSQTITPRTVRQVVDEFLETKEKGRSTRIKSAGRTVSERYLYDLRKKLDKFAARFNCPISTVTAKDVNQFVYDLRKVSRAAKRKAAHPPKPVTGRTINNYLQAINVLFEFAKKQSYVARDFALMDEVEQAEEADFEIEIFTPREIALILGHARADIVPVLAIGAFAGIRSAEISRLDWSEVHLDKCLIEIKKGKAKTRSRRLVPISDNLAAWLKTCAKPAGPVWAYSEPTMFEFMTDSATKAGLKWRHNALRHSYISYRVADGKTVDQVAMESGNSPEMIFQHYRELVTEADSKAWFAVTPETAAAAKDQQDKEKAAQVVGMPTTQAA